MVQVEFYAIAALTIASSIIALEAKDMVHGAFALAASFAGIAFFFALLEAPFLALFQLVVYVGAIAVLILFTVMLVRRERWLQIQQDVSLASAIIGGGVLASGMILVAYFSGFADWLPPAVTTVAFENIGTQLVSQFWLVLIVLGLVMAAAILGAVTLAKVERER